MTTATSTRPRVRRVRLFASVSHALRRRLTEYGIAKGRPESQIVEDALAHYFASRCEQAAPPGPAERLVDAIDRAEEGRERQGRELADALAEHTQALGRIERTLSTQAERASEHRQGFELLALAFGTFLRIWLGHLPDLPAETMRRISAIGGERYELFLQALANHFASGHRFTSDIPRPQGPAAR